MPIAPGGLLDQEPTGQSYLPRKLTSNTRYPCLQSSVARVKKTVSADEDVQAISAQSTFLISKATVTCSIPYSDSN